MSTIETDNIRAHHPRFQAGMVKKQSTVLYTIDSSETHKNSVPGSPFPRRERPFTEPITSSTDVVIGKGVALPELIRKFYRGATPFAIRGQWGFLDRHNKERKYDPGIADRFVFKNNQSLTYFKEEALRLISILVKYWVNLGLPLKKDEDRQIMLPDQDFLIDNPDGVTFLKNATPSVMDSVYFIIGNIDILKKACIVRSITAGWWAVSYAGKSANDLSFFQGSLEAHARAIKTIASSPKGRQTYHKFWQAAGDPLTTNPGYPFFNAEISADGLPITRIKTVELFGDLMKGRNWKEILEEIDRRASKFGLPGHPLAVAPIIRLQYGYKWEHLFNITPSGMQTTYDSRGFNSQRVAHMVPYIYNLMTSPISTAYKAVRYMLPGAYHDGPAKTQRLAQLAGSTASKRTYLLEADYSNFDRFMAVDLIQKVTDMVADAYDLSNSDREMMMYLHNDASLLWPDYSSVSSGNGWVFKPGQLGLLSGVKLTSELGTKVNSVINLQVVMNTKGWSVDRAVEYLTQYVNAPTGSRPEYYYIQSDDSQLIASSVDELLVMAKEFRKAVKAAGLKGEVAVADRFLMRLMQNGSDRPVASRVWQNTLSNETSPDDAFVFLVGLTSRTDGLYGLKTVDPFDTVNHQQITDVEVDFTNEVIRSLRTFISTSSVPITEAIRFCDTLLQVGTDVKAPMGRYVQIDKSLKPKLDSIRRAAAQALAEMELKKLNQTSVQSYISELVKDRNVPSSSMLLEQLVSLAPSLTKVVESITGKEEAFFRYAAKRVGVKPLL